MERKWKSSSIAISGTRDEVSGLDSPLLPPSTFLPEILGKVSDLVRRYIPEYPVSREESKKRAINLKGRKDMIELRSEGLEGPTDSEGLEEVGEV